MPNRSFSQFAVALLCAALVACASHPGPPSLRMSAHDVQKSALGGWVVVNLLHESVAGELIAVDSKTLHVGIPGRHEITHIPLSAISKVKLYAYEASTGPTSAMVTLGTLSTLTHGVFLILTAPVWLIAGGATVGVQSRMGFFTYGRPFSVDSLAAMQKYARYPQGLPTAQAADPSPPRQAAPAAAPPPAGPATEIHPPGSVAPASPGVDPKAAPPTPAAPQTPSSAPSAQPESIQAPPP